MNPVRIAVVSDLHYAGPEERARGNDYEYRDLANPVVKALLRFHRRHLWLRNPLDRGYLLDRFLTAAQSADYAIANGDYSCDSAFIGLCDDASFHSAQACIGAIRARFGNRAAFAYGDHELGKASLGGAQGGLRLASFHRAEQQLGLPPFWKLEIGVYTCMGFASTLVGLPVFMKDAPPAELPEWEQLRQEHLANIRAAFSSLTPNTKVLLFCHDPTALPFLWREEAVRSRLAQVEQTIIGHLHSPLILRQSRLLAGMPAIKFLGPTITRLSSALRDARHWRPFKVRLCPAAAGIELLKDGGFLWVELDPAGNVPARFVGQRLPR